jgi:antitoxin (DNA-binding transcriptional repressor) of toxin-antitoxin stability system
LRWIVSAYSVAQAKNNLPSLIAKAEAGEEVVITRHGKPVAELRARPPAAGMSPSAAYERLAAGRVRLKTPGLTAVRILDEMYEEDR